MRVVIEDTIHCERIAECESFETAVERLRQLAQLPWDEAPNVAPCTSWRKCGREFQIVEWDDSSTPWKVVREADALKVSASGVEWILGFEYVWAERH